MVNLYLQKKSLTEKRYTLILYVTDYADVVM
jgi:hypothetical protein